MKVEVYTSWDSGQFYFLPSVLWDTEYKCINIGFLFLGMTIDF